MNSSPLGNPGPTQPWTWSYGALGDQTAAMNFYRDQMERMARLRMAQPEPKPKPKIEVRGDLFYGWRLFKLESGKLRGLRQTWASSRLKARCYVDKDTAAVRKLLEDDDVFETWMQRRAEQATTRCVVHLENNSCSDAHGCGIYGRVDPASLAIEDGFVYARCLAWGTVAVDEDGNWRASDVDIESLFIRREQTLSGPALYIDWERMAADLGVNYGVPVSIIDSIKDLPAETQ